MICMRSEAEAVQLQAVEKGTVSCRQPCCPARRCRSSISTPSDGASYGGGGSHEIPPPALARQPSAAKDYFRQFVGGWNCEHPPLFARSGNSQVRSFRIGRLERNRVSRDCKGRGSTC